MQMRLIPRRTVVKAAAGLVAFVPAAATLLRAAPVEASCGTPCYAPYQCCQIYYQNGHSYCEDYTCQDFCDTVDYHVCYIQQTDNYANCSCSSCGATC